MLQAQVNSIRSNGLNEVLRAEPEACMCTPASDLAETPTAERPASGQTGDGGVEGLQLGHEVLVAAVDEVDALDPAGALGGQGRDEVGEATAQVGNDDVGTGQRRGSGDDRGVVEVALTEAALVPPRHSR